MASSSYNQYSTVNLGEEYTYPYPSHVNTHNFVTLKLSGRDNYAMWKTQMVFLLESHDMLGFIDGTLLSPSLSGKEKEGHHHTPRLLWRRSDALVKGWIAGSLSEQTLGLVLNRLTDNEDFSAKDIWDELQTVYGSAVFPQPHSHEHVLPPPQPLVISTAPPIWVPGPDVRTPEEKELAEKWKAIYLDELLEATQSRSWPMVCRILGLDYGITAMDKITNNGDTTLHIAVGTTKNPDVIKKLFQLTPEGTKLDVRNSDGSTILHVACIVGNTEAVKILLEKKRDMLYLTDNQGQTPLALVLSNMHTKTYQHILNNLTIDDDIMFSGKSGDELLISVISSNNFRLASRMVSLYLKFENDAVLMAIAQNFPSELSKVEKYLDSFVNETITDDIFQRVYKPYKTFSTQVRRYSLLCYWLCVLPASFFVGILWIILHFPGILKTLVWLIIKRRAEIHHHTKDLLARTHFRIKPSNYGPRSHADCYVNPLFEAIKQNAYEMVVKIVLDFPDAMLSAKKDGHNIIEYAVINRSEKVYNLLYQMSEHKNVYRASRDSSGNNLLHLAGRLAPTDKLDHISGAALQIQRELQWFKEVERFVCPLNIKQKNFLGETPQMVFTREHKELVIEGEKWLKATAESYTITAALITTIVFAAAITVPGGNNQDKGIPVFIDNPAFTVFAISDAISLFAAATSLLMFLSILTARFAEQDFLRKLPTKLIIGLITLFISTTAMITAFGATLYLEFGRRNPKILSTIVVLTCIPIICFATLQFSLIIDLMRATYGWSIFGKQRNWQFY